MVSVAAEKLFDVAGADDMEDGKDPFPEIFGVLEVIRLEVIGLEARWLRRRTHSENSLPIVTLRS